MERKIIPTADGSLTVEIPELGVTYHSRHGAVQESMHVFIEAGLRQVITGGATAISIFEMGFGTGLNALLTATVAAQQQLSMQYTAVEKFPLNGEEASLLQYEGFDTTLLQQLHAAPWQEATKINEHFTITKLHGDLQSATLPQASFHLVYYDAFAPATQPQLWTEAIFRKLHEALLPGGILVTYCSKGDVRRALIAAGFSVEKIPGPPGKREMLRGISNR